MWPPEAHAYHHGRVRPIALETWTYAAQCFYPSGCTIIRPGQHAESFFYIHAGRVRISRIMNDTEKVFAYAGPGEFFGDAPFFEGRRHWYMARAVEPCQTSVISGEALRRIVKASPEFMLAVLESLAHMSWMMASQMIGIAYDPSHCRLARTLMEISEQENRGGRGADVVCITHQELAALVGTSRVMVTRTLRAWQEQGLVCLRKGRVEVLNPVALQSLAASF